jgi:hypothetical protein
MSKLILTISSLLLVTSIFTGINGNAQNSGYGSNNSGSGIVGSGGTGSGNSASTSGTTNTNSSSQSSNNEALSSLVRSGGSQSVIAILALFAVAVTGIYIANAKQNRNVISR